MTTISTAYPSGSATYSNSISRSHTTPASYCYRVTAQDIAGNVITTSGTSCVTKA